VSLEKMADEMGGKELLCGEVGELKAGCRAGGLKDDSCCADVDAVGEDTLTEFELELALGVEFALTAEGGGGGAAAAAEGFECC
jgi:hypothetical protein